MAEALDVAVPDVAQPTRVLEVGCGGVQRAWARYCGGLLFDDPSVEYVGIDPVVEVLGPAARVTNEAVVLPVDCQDMPFDDGVFDVVMMRSLFGQCTDDDMLHRLHGLAHMGLMEAYRVLKPGGDIVVAEENTPFDAHVIERLLTGLGFAVDAFAYMSEPHWTKVNPDSPWLRLRRAYYADDPLQQSKWNTQGDSPPYIMISSKPEGAEEVEERVHLGFNPDNGADVFTNRTYVHGVPVVATPLTTNKFETAYE